MSGNSVIVLADPTERAKERDADSAYEDLTLKEWKRRGDHADLTVEGSWGWSSMPRWPKDAPDAGVGQRVRVWTRGSTIRGISLWRGAELVPIFYQTEAEAKAEHGAWIADHQRRQHREFAKGRERLDAAYEALPPPLKRRIDRFRDADPDFRWREESYEMAACAEAGRLYRAALDPAFGAALKAAGIKGPTEAAKAKSSYEWTEDDGTADWDDTPENRLRAFDAINSKLNGYAHDRMRGFLPDMDDGHSGNTWGHAVAFALALIRDDGASL